ncbi:MAG: flagellar motor stator protein MotA [Alphaproteobacteria bacterium]|nr:flagellar motor stator protein MotA [Alphaproteobacteria bacterium]
MQLNFVIGVVTAVACTLGGYVGAGGHLSVLADAAPLEIVIMGGTAAGGFIIANTKTIKKRTAKAMKLLFQKPKYTKESYIELLSMMYQMFKLAKTKGMLALEAHVEKPEESSIFQAFPGFLNNHHAVEFFCDYLRLFTLGADKPFEIEALMDEELEVHHAENEAIPTAITNVADAMPAIGIVAAVLGVIHTMGAISEPPEVLGKLIGGALVGTFMGVWTSYGFIAPMGQFVKATLDAESRYLQCLKVGMLAHLQGFAPSISIEYARKALMTDVRPSFMEVEEATQALSAPS